MPPPPVAMKDFTSTLQSRLPRQYQDGTPIHPSSGRELSPGSAFHCFFSNVVIDLVAWLSSCILLQLCQCQGLDQSHAATAPMAPASDTAFTNLKPDSLGETQGLVQRALAPAGAASGPESSFARGSGYTLCSKCKRRKPNCTQSAAASAPAPAIGVPQSSSSGSAGRNSERGGAASVESASAEDSPVTGGNTAASGALGPVLAPQQALAPRQALAPGPQSSSGGLPGRSGNNASASIEGLPADGSDSTSAPAVAPSAVLAPSSPPASSDLAGVRNDLSMNWWLWLLVAMATVATWLSCCCCMAAVLLLHRRSRRRIM